MSSLGWRGIFYVLAGIAAAQLLVALFVIPETRPPANRTPLSFGSFTAVIKEPVFIRYALVVGFGFTSMFAYISASSFVMQEIMGLSPQIFALVFGTNALGLMVGGALNTRLLDRFPAAAILKIALIIMTVAATIVLVCALNCLPRIPFFLALFFAVMPLSLVMGNATALAVAAVRTRAGSASSVMGFGQFLLAGLVSPLVGMVGGSQAVGMGVCMVGAAVVAVMMFGLARRAG